jgi:hypothetical protein
VKLTLTRRWFEPTCTIGTLDIDEHAECYILEDVEREVKVPHETCIPCGTYVIAIDYSKRFQRRLPHLLDVPGFTGIRIHPGSSALDTSGCLLPGMEKYDDSLGHSGIAFDHLFGQLLMAESLQDLITIEIKHDLARHS